MSKSDYTAFLLAEMEKIGFVVIDGSVSCFVGDDGNPLTAKKAAEEGLLDKYMTKEGTNKNDKTQRRA